ncbi:hypothetical protein [Sulfurospirillum barnesii]|uniref:Uncharacterized protein n=1 Tax=Sulfurospirillum barnesii (strain ATCC 700032 / DSM 10660 / SES-3) TaxID=760154 RepID=I3XWP1_SULBS|nr:hypothetical protein [Sulfurospirillum barnesii]AFL68365.1 hypothetical protein Sulba_1068 [Sulfurospirillum barnesii SES-3]
MIPVVVGSIALVAAGYGLKKYLNDESFFESDVFSTLEEDENDDTDALSSFDVIKKTLENSTLKEVFLALGEIKNLPLELSIKPLQSYKETAIDLPLNDENLAILKSFCDVLEKVKSLLNTLLDELDMFVVRENDYSKYNHEEKEKMQELVLLVKTLQEVLSLPLTFDHVTINRAVKRGYEKLKHFEAI